jgi:hypothetical protein
MLYVMQEKVPGAEQVEVAGAEVLDEAIALAQALFNEHSTVCFVEERIGTETEIVARVG